MADSEYSFLRYYKGEDECPPQLVKEGNTGIWFYEQTWAERKNIPNYFEDNIAEYIACGLEHFEENDGTPISLKALLYNRYCHWVGGYDIENDVSAFKEWYVNDYK